MSKAPTTSSSESNFLSPGETGEVGDLRVPAALACFSAFCLWVIPIGSSLWLDELVTFWSSYKGIVPAIARSQFWPGQNTAYTVLIASIIRVAGTSEVVLRLPSLIAVVLTAWLLFRLGETFLDKEAGILVVVVFTSLHEVAREAATNARPYSIALLLVVASMLQLVRWLDSQRLRNMAGFTVTAAAIPYFHLMFATIYLVFFAYGVYRWLTERRIRIKQIALEPLW
jgi:mannosyltransferase